MSTNTTSATDNLIADLISHLGEKPYFTGQFLIEIGLFGSQTALAQALKRGDLPTIRISPKRQVVPRKAVIEYVRKNLAESIR